jgi:uncharacterized protein YndB with AHSA1/START domain
MPTVSTSTIVPRPAEEVFDFLADARNLALWSSGVAAVAPDAVPPGENAEYHYHFPGRHREHRLVCSVFQPGRRITFRGRRMWSPLGTQVPEYGFRLVPHPHGTLVGLTVTCILHGPMVLLAPVMAMAWRRDLPEDAHKLRELLRGPSTAPPAPSLSALSALQADGAYGIAPARPAPSVRAGIGT